MLYFAYGSNMLLQRLRERVPSARPLGPARLSGYALAWHKVGRLDGSGKCDIVPNEDAIVWGVLYDIDTSQKYRLDMAEDLGNGYEATTVFVECEGVLQRANSYTASLIDSSIRPFQWYKELVIAGARQNGLPPEYIDVIERVETVSDPDKDRCNQHLDIVRRSQQKAGGIVANAPNPQPRRSPGDEKIDKLDGRIA